jgi:carbamoyl-phosphate synthase small subunit
MQQSQAQAPRRTAILALADGLILKGQGLGASGEAVGEVCFNTAMTGYQEVLTDPSYAGQIITFTFPHIGNVGVNAEDIENSSQAAATAALGAIFREPPTNPSSYRAQLNLSAWMKRRGIIGICGVDTRALTARIRDLGMPHAAIAYSESGQFDEAGLIAKAKAWKGLEGRDLARDVSTLQSYSVDETAWKWGVGYGKAKGGGPHVVVIDYGVKRNILRLLCEAGARVTVVPATASFDDIVEKRPDGVVLSNGPGDPAATGAYSIPVIRRLIETKTPTLGICLGHQMLALALGARTYKMHQGHRGANHPVKEVETGKVEITSMNHGFAVDAKTLPAGVEETHVSLFDGTNCGLRVAGKNIFSVQHHPEASPGPQDSFYLFRRFMEMVG